MDRQWWQQYQEHAAAIFTGRFASSIQATGVDYYPRIRAGNSGAGALLLAAELGAQQIIMLGYDCQHTGGQAHWHADHPAGMGNAGTVDKWPQQFEAVARRLTAVDVVNCSRETALTTFRRARLEDTL